jgi:hypothetical protein
MFDFDSFSAVTFDRSGPPAMGIHKKISGGGPNIFFNSSILIAKNVHFLKTRGQSSQKQPPFPPPLVDAHASTSPGSSPDIVCWKGLFWQQA